MIKINNKMIMKIKKNKKIMILNNNILLNQTKC